MVQPYDTLADALSDVGIWRWWNDLFPDAFQLEFTGVQLYSAPLSEGKPPCGQFALRFLKPRSVAFLTLDRAAPDNWPDLMHADKLDAAAVDHDGFFFNDPDQARALLDKTLYLDNRFGPPPIELPLGHTPVILSFQAGAIGCFVAAEEVTLVGSPHGADGSPIL